MAVALSGQFDGVIKARFVNGQLILIFDFRVDCFIGEGNSASVSSGVFVASLKFHVLFAAE